MKSNAPLLTYLSCILLMLMLAWPAVGATGMHLADATRFVFSSTGKSFSLTFPLAVADAKILPLAFIELPSDSILYRGIKYAGKFHLLFIHFPIAFLLGAVVAQWVAVIRKTAPSTLVRVFLWAGATGAVIAAALGWIFAYDTVYFGDSENLLFWHRWLGTSTALVSVVALAVAARLRPLALAFTLTVCGGLVIAAAHYGGSLARGPDFLLEF